MHTHQSLWKGGKPLFAGDGYGGLSEMALYYIGGILKHAPALCAFTQPDDELATSGWCPGFEAPVNLAYSSRNRSASIRIPMYSAVAEGEAHRVPHPRPVLQRLPRVRRAC